MRRALLGVLGVCVVVCVVAPAVGHPDPSPIRHAIRIRMPVFRACYTEELAKHPGLEGKVIATFTIATTGKVTESRARGLPVVEDCVAKVIRTITFPPIRKGSTIVNYPFVFVPH